MKLQSLLVAISGQLAIVTIALPLLAQTAIDPIDPLPKSTTLTQLSTPNITPQPSIKSSCDNETSDPGKSVVVSKVRVLDSADREILRSDWAAITQPSIGKTISIGELGKIADRLTQTYLDRGAITSRVILCQIKEGLITFQSIEGSIEQVNITGLVKLDPGYVRSRLALATDTPLNANKLEDQLRLLRADPLFSNVEASLQAGSGIGKSILNVRVTEANPLGIGFTTDNYSSPSVGGERIGTSIDYRNIVGQGDSASLVYNHALSSGTNFFDFTYKIPINPMQGTLQARIAPSSNQITIPPFQNSGYFGRSQFYELSYRQPFIRNPRQEFALSWGLALQTGETFIRNTPTPLSFGADGQGVSKATVLKFGQDYVSRELNGAWGAKSVLNFGVGIFGATINPQPTPDGRFFSWQGQLQRAQVLDSNQLLVAQLDAQLASNPLLSIEQFAIGGGQSVRGFRQNVRSADNGVRLSVENRITIQRDAAGTQTLVLAPFIDTGWVWNQANNPDNQFPSQNFLAGIGLGVIWQPTSQWNIRVDYGLPLVNLQDRGNNIQDSGLYFSLNYKL